MTVNNLSQRKTSPFKEGGFYLVVCLPQLVGTGESARDQIFYREPVEDLEPIIRYPTAMLNFYAVSGPVFTIPHITSGFYRKTHILLNSERRITS